MRFNHHLPSVTPKVPTRSIRYENYHTFELSICHQIFSYDISVCIFIFYSYICYSIIFGYNILKTLRIWGEYDNIFHLFECWIKTENILRAHSASVSDTRVSKKRYRNGGEKNWHWPKGPHKKKDLLSV